jgi:hypothetical protein
VFQAYPVPHRELDARHRIIIENDELHKADVAQYGAYQAQKLGEQGKYNSIQKNLKLFTFKLSESFSIYIQ